jgi:hypothetical protein
LMPVRVEGRRTAISHRYLFAMHHRGPARFEREWVTEEEAADDKVGSVAQIAR